MYDKEDSRPSPKPVGFRHKALSYALQNDDIDLLILATKEELDALRGDAALMAKVKDGAHIVYTAWFLGSHTKGKCSDWKAICITRCGSCKPTLETSER